MEERDREEGTSGGSTVYQCLLEFRFLQNVDSCGLLFGDRYGFWMLLSACGGPFFVGHIITLCPNNRL